MSKDMRYVVTVENMLKPTKRVYCYASHSLAKCRDYVSRKHRGCRLMTRSTDKENDPTLVEKYIHVFSRTLREKIILIIRILYIELDDYEEEILHEKQP